MNNKNLALIFFSLLVIVAIVFSVNKYLQNKKSSEEIPNQNQITSKLQEVDRSKLPEKFPADFPLEQGVKILNNYNVLDTGFIQATRKFTTKKSLPENYKLYSNYLSQNGWEISSKLDLEETKSVSATKEGVNVSIVVSHNPNTNINSVDIAFTYKN